MSHKLGSASYRERFISCIFKANENFGNSEFVKSFVFRLAQEHPEIFMRTVEDCFEVQAASKLTANDKTILAMCRAGRHINGIKHRREVTREGLAEARDYVVDLCKKNGVECLFSSNS